MQKLSVTDFTYSVAMAVNLTTIWLIYLSGSEMSKF